MKLLLTILAAPLVLAAPTAAQSAQDTAHYQTYEIHPAEPYRASATEMWRVRILSLRREALELQERDGGTLTPEHRAMLQAKLNRINAELRRS